MEPDNEGSQYCLVKKNSHKGKEVAVGTEPNTKQNNDSIINIEEDDTIVNDAQKIAVQNSSTPKFNLIQSANNEPISLRRNSSVKDKKDHRRVTHQPTLERKSSLSPTQAYLSDTADQYNSIGKKRCRMVRGKSIAVPITTTPQQCQLASKDDFRVSYTSLRSEDSSLVPDAHVKEQRRLEKMFREIQRRVHSPENSCSSGFLSPNDTVPDTHRSGARRSYPIENSSSLGRQDQEENKKTGSGYSIYYALPITRNDGVGRNRSVSISPMLYSDISSYLEGRTLIHSRRASFASPARGGRASVDSRIYSRRSSNATSVVDHHVHRGSRPRLSKIGKSVSLNPRFSSDVESFDPLLDSSRVASSYLDNGVDVLSVAGIQSTLPRPNSLPLEYTSELRLKLHPKEEKKRQRATIIVSSGALTFILLAASLVTMSFLMSPVIERVFVQDKLNNTPADYNFSDYDYMNYTGMKLHHGYPIRLDTRSNETSRDSGYFDSG